MHIIKLNAINSTNSYAREMFKRNPGLQPTCIVAKQQLEGRGQRGTTWSSNAGQNLTFSIFYPNPEVPVSHQFLLSATIATAIVKSLATIGISRLKVKWPNDIMAANTKIGGILIENILGDGRMIGTIVGIGLNVNQTDFDGLPAAGSLKLVTGQHFDLDEVLHKILCSLEESLHRLGERKPEEIMGEYVEYLFRYRAPSTFQLPDLTLFTGVIEKVSLNGKLLIRAEDDQLREYDLKEVKLCF